MKFSNVSLAKFHPGAKWTRFSDVLPSGTAFEPGKGGQRSRKAMRNSVQRSATHKRAHLTPPGYPQRRENERNESGSQIVTMMQSTEFRHGYNSTPRACFSCYHQGRRSSHLQHEMRSIIVVIDDELTDQPLQMTFA